MVVPGIKNTIADVVSIVLFGEAGRIGGRKWNGPKVSYQKYYDDRRDDRRMLFENCRLQAKMVCNPIIDWTDADVWDYINSEHLTLNPLYQCGFYRVGCVGCPMAKKTARQRDFARYPKYKAAYIAAFDRMLEERRRRGKMRGEWRAGTTAIEVFHWLMEDGVLPGQLNFDDLAGLMEDDEA